jgi:hypothetical protein
MRDRKRRAQEHLSRLRREVLKGRQRVIEHPADINEAAPEVDRVEFLTGEARTRAVLAGDTVLDLDFSAWFDQFGLPAELRPWFMFAAGGCLWQLMVLSMGLRHSVAVAHHTTRQLLNFDLKGVFAEAYIDNVRFVGKRQAVPEAATTFMERCRTVGATLNEVNYADYPDLAKAAESLVKSRGEWLGEDYDYEQKTVAVTEKTKWKIADAAALQSRSWRGVASYISLLRYASRTLNLCLAPFFPALRAFAAASRLLGKRPDLWDDTAPAVRPHVAANLELWKNTILAAGPRQVEATEQPSSLLVTDASDWGWGAALVGIDGSVKTIAKRWSVADRMAGLATNTSAHAEPEGVLRALCALVKPSDSGSIRILTDSTTAKYAIGKGYSPAFFVNTVVGRIKKTFPRLKIDIAHTPGTSMPVDGISRGEKALSAAEWATLVSMAQKNLELRGELGIPTGCPAHGSDHQVPMSMPA